MKRALLVTAGTVVGIFATVQYAPAEPGDLAAAGLDGLGGLSTDPSPVSTVDPSCTGRH